MFFINKNFMKREIANIYPPPPPPQQNYIANIIYHLLYFTYNFGDSTWRNGDQGSFINHNINSYLHRNSTWKEILIL